MKPTIIIDAGHGGYQLRRKGKLPYQVDMFIL